MQKTYSFLRDPTIGLRIAHEPHTTLSVLPADVRKVFTRLYSTALYLKSNEDAPRAPIMIELLEEYWPNHDAASYYAELPSAIVEIHGYFADFVRHYLPRNLRQLFTSEGIITNVDDPADLVVSIFFPNDIRGNGSASRLSGLEEIRSWIALRTWFCAVRWLAERDILQRGRERMQRITAAFEDGVFASCSMSRIRDIHVRYNPHGFVFREIADSLGKTTVTMPLSSRHIDVKGTPVEVFFHSRVKSPDSIWRKVNASRKISDHLAEMIIFLTGDDYHRASAMLTHTVLHEGKPKVAGGRRVDGTPNPNAFTYDGVYWSGTINVGGIISELECASMKRYFNGVAGLTMFNHLVYEVRRLFRQNSDGSPCLWEMIFPCSLYTPLTLELKVRMITRQLALVAEDFYPHDAVRARAEIERVGNLLHAHPQGIDDPLSVRGLMRL
ncbi:MAG: hypothetical protein UX10_C0012G0004 [Candidatus Magasanikbacteria bacterium GW2011_GWA2_45_39]|uniref:Uncharacterized protein n=2 Tax=Candidatus Magasanikiibacteriota TaxID=1752731 RepID=A0A0G1Q6G7_9BACT|nr:MAG: hypothetical protein UX10_C0012G0004 [Candidatus Magasanikbacteria bacterium GW2011_GWA2_45_39]KKU13348.1 MAG: hypothetical protein UX20_C0024G0008 [Candidatus Magasanikbacteria bacterium GW2011_GWC2_45_8]HBW73702.1 hypothetical protein [Candidatus Magasanikbacteria bacterium]